ncbi:MAG: SUMF1/EgtB/PvdO family nonheme iron enzyme [Rhodobacterales bacterium]|nr:SUMF1/EgtB/PvdO family nonheme iron enzyme [Rhodobacterales bacterium]
MLVILAAAQAQAQTPAAAPWAEKFYNPQPLADDLVLPLPCGGAMAFRRVEVPSDGWLGDRKIVIGGREEGAEQAESSRYAYVAGGFTDAGNPARRFYYLGKYEVSDLQRDALDSLAPGGACPKARMRGRLPAGGVTWQDANTLAHAYTAWLLADAPGRLPAEDGVPGFLRLPTETEWEYAARGGAAVSGTEFQQRTFPVPQGLAKYVWHAGPRSAGGKVQLTGLLMPNPLGLHDMLGNLDEIVLEPFRLSKFSRDHGQPGGFVIRGGNYLTSAPAVRSSYRQEVTPFAKGQPNRVRTVGFRLAIGAPVLPTRERLQAVRADWLALPQSVTVTSGTDALDDPVAELEVVRRATGDPDLRARLERLSLVVKANIASRNEQRDRAAQGLVRLGAFLGRKIVDDQKKVDALDKILKGRRAAQSSERLIRTSEQSLAHSRAVLADNVEYYGDTVIQAVRDYPADVLRRQLEALKVGFANRGRQGLIPFADLFAHHTEDYRRSETLDTDAWLRAFRER